MLNLFAAVCQRSLSLQTPAKSETVTREFENVAAVSEPIEWGAGQSRIAKDFRPFRIRKIGSDHEQATKIVLADKGKEHLGSSLAERHKTQRRRRPAGLGQAREYPGGHAPRVRGDPRPLRRCRTDVCSPALTALWGDLLIARFVAHLLPELAQHHSLNGKALNGPVVGIPPWVSKRQPSSQDILELAGCLLVLVLPSHQRTAGTLPRTRLRLFPAGSLIRRASWRWCHRHGRGL